MQVNEVTRAIRSRGPRGPRTPHRAPGPPHGGRPRHGGARREDRLARRGARRGRRTKLGDVPRHRHRTVSRRVRRARRCRAQPSELERGRARQAEAREKKGETKKIYTYTDRDIARVAGVSMGAVRVAKTRGKILANDLRSVSVYIIEHWLKTMQRKGKR